MRALLGAAEGPAYPIQVRLFSNWLAPEEQTTALAYAIPVGVSVSLILGGPLAAILFGLTHQWETMFYVIGALSIVLAVVWYLVVRDQPQDSRMVSKEELIYVEDSIARSGRGMAPTDSASSVSAWRLLSDRTLLSTYLGFFALGYVFWFALAWLPGYFQEAHHLSVGNSALLVTLPWVLYGVGSLVAGYISDMVYKRTKSLRIKKHFIWVSLVLSGLLLIPTFFSANLLIDVIFISLTVGVAGLCVPPLWALNSDIVPYRSGLSSGLMDAAFALAGFLAPFITGLVIIGNNFNIALVLNTAVCIAGGLTVILMSAPDQSAQKFKKANGRLDAIS